MHATVRFEKDPHLQGSASASASTVASQRPHRRQPGDQQHHGQAMQHAEDEGLRYIHPSAGRDQHRTARHLNPTPSKAGPASADDRHLRPPQPPDKEQADDGTALPGPDRQFRQGFLRRCGLRSSGQSKNEKPSYSQVTAQPRRASTGVDAAGQGPSLQPTSHKLMVAGATIFFKLGQPSPASSR